MARNVLIVDDVAFVMPRIGEALSGTIDARGQWSELPDTAAAVLEGLHSRLDELLKEGGEA